MKVNWFQMIVSLLGGLGVFLYGMRVMSRGLESAGSDRMRSWLQTMTAHPLAGITTGLVVTCVIQSSSATTVMLVSLVHAGFLQLTQAIGVVMGANIGTTFTGWVVALLGFKIKISRFALPAIAIGVSMIFLWPRRKRGLWGEILVGFGLLFLGLMFMKQAVKPLSKSPEVIAWMQHYSASSGYLSILMAVGIGTLATLAIQSSSATMALTMTLAQQGLIDFPTAAALILGENIGTTVTANLAAIGTNISARRAAVAHFFFNTLGVCWVILIFYPFIHMIEWMVPGQVLATDLAVRNQAIASHMAAYHTTFNVLNTIIFLPFVGALAKLVTRVIPGELAGPEKQHILYLDSRLVSTPDLALTAAHKELHRMSEHATEMFRSVMKLYRRYDQASKPLVERIEHCEDVLDNLEREIAQYLTEVSQHQLSAKSTKEVADLMNMAHNYEKIGDHCESLLRYLKRKYDNDVIFSKEGATQILELAQLVDEFLALIEANILAPTDIMKGSNQLEKAIDKMRGELRDEHTQRLIKGECDVPAALIFIDMLTSFEKIGDHAFNIASYLSQARDH
ncbi:MAG: Na/Pi cotransporter family protein [Deltaproteobacteria bacterium]|nr:MAG: Na/Pi cotransporter family protein [Deltaproteobacteria bacterium]